MPQNHLTAALESMDASLPYSKKTKQLRDAIMEDLREAECDAVPIEVWGTDIPPNQDLFIIKFNKIGELQKGDYLNIHIHHAPDNKFKWELGIYVATGPKGVLASAKTRLDGMSSHAGLIMDGLVGKILAVAAASARS